MVKPSQSLAEILYGRMIPSDNSAMPAAQLPYLTNAGFLKQSGPFAMTSNGKPVLPDYIHSTPMYGPGQLTPKLGSMMQNYWTSIFYPQE